MKFDNFNKPELRRRHSLSGWASITWIISMTALLSPLAINGQVHHPIETPAIGQKFPQFKLSNVENFHKQSATLNDFKGKWLIVEFWHQYCSACLAGFPKTDSIEKKYNDKIKYLLIGIIGTGFDKYHDPKKEIKSIKSLYDKVKIKNRLSLTIAYDSALPRRFNISTSPTYVVIDPDGIIRGKTVRLTEENLADFIAGKTPQLYPSFEHLEHKRFHSYDITKPLLTNCKPANGGYDTSYLFRSLLTKWDTAIARNYPQTTSPTSIPRSFEAVGVDIISLYKYAFIGVQYWNLASDSLYGKVWQEPILEVKDSTKLKGDYITGENMYSYSLTLPASISKKIGFMRFMQSDLKNYFGYEVSVEERKMPYWSLRLVSPEAGIKLKTKSDSSYVSQELLYQGFIAKNRSVKSLIDFLHPSDEIMPIIDETGLSFNIDLEVNALLTDKVGNNDMMTSLYKNGLTMVQSKKTMKVLVIKDANKRELNVLGK